MTTRRLLLLHPTRMSGESHGLYIQHVASMQWLLRGEDGWDVVAMDVRHPALSDVALTSDVVVVHMLGSREIESLIRLRRERNLSTLFELGDNFLDLGVWLPKSHSLRNPLVRQQILYHASLSDGMQVYSPGLASLFRHVHENVILFDPYVPLARRTGGEAAFVMGWGGTTSHGDDLQRIAPVIVAFCRRHPDAIFAYMGDAALFARVFAQIPAAQTRVRPFGPYEEYLDFVSSLDVGLAPLGESAFNACRTDTKFATYAARGVAAVLEDHEVYRVHADRAIIFRSPAELDAALESLYADPSRRARLADRAHEWATRERSAERLRAQRVAAYESLMPYQTREAPRIGSWPERERLSEALAVQDGDAAVAMLQEIVAEFPRYDQARLALCRWHEHRGDFQRALDLLEGAEISLLFADVAEDLRLRLVRHAQPHGEARQSSDSDTRDSLKGLLQRHPYHYLALANRIRELLAEDPSSHELPDLFLRACLVAPELVPVEHRPPAIARYLPA